LPQISLYIDESTLRKVESAAARQNVSISKWVAEQIRAKVEPVFPKNFEALFGSVSDESFYRPFDLQSDTDSRREEF